MKPTENIEKRIKNVGVVLDPETNKKMFNNTLQAFKTSKAYQSAATAPNMWRMIMKSGITKLAAAVVIIVAVFIGTNKFGGTVDFATVAFAEMTEAMEKVPWVHATMTDSLDAKDVHEEQWLNPRLQISITKKSDGTVLFIDYGAGKSYKYRPTTNRITISAIDPRTFDSIMPLQWNWSEIERWWSRRDPTVDISYSEKRIGNTEAKVYQLNRGRDGRRCEITVNSETDLPLTFLWKQMSQDGVLAMDTKISFTYPGEGPASIYEVGVPRSAEISDYTQPALKKDGIESARKLNELFQLLANYAAEHGESLPDTLQELGSEDINILQWAIDNVEYLGKGKTFAEYVPAPIAYDKTLFERYDQAAILFMDGHVETSANPDAVTKIEESRL